MARARLLWGMGVGGILSLLIVSVGVFFWLNHTQSVEPAPEISPVPIVEAVPPQVRFAIIGRSVEGRNIEAFTYGAGDQHLLLVGGIHGGYEWNSVLLAYEFMDYLDANPADIPGDIRVTIIPSLNPDGVFKVVGKEGRFVAADIPPSADESEGRFNARGVDLNRNFGCKWKPKSTWRGVVVSAGTSAFSEPEAVALRDFVLKEAPNATVFWHSQANAVYASECEEGILPHTLSLMRTYADASGYTPVESFDAYEVSGDVEGWMASINIPAITVELSTHDTIEWEKNKAGISALFALYSSLN